MVSKADGAKVFNPNQTLKVFAAVYDAYSLIVRDELIYSCVNLPFFDNFKAFESWLQQKKAEERDYYNATLKLLTKISKMRFEAYDDYLKSKLSSNSFIICENSNVE